MQAILEDGSPELLQVALIDVELARSKFWFQHHSTKKDCNAVLFCWVEWFTSTQKRSKQ
jgi:hypothetical protein